MGNQRLCQEFSFALKIDGDLKFASQTSAPVTEYPVERQFPGLGIAYGKIFGRKLGAGHTDFPSRCGDLHRLFQGGGHATDGLENHIGSLAIGVFRNGIFDIFLVGFIFVQESRD